MTRTIGFVAGAALAVGLAIGFAGSALAASPTSSASYRSMMGGDGMVGQTSFGPGSTFGPGMMGGSSSDQIQRCDEIHDAMHASASPSTSPSPR
jgi:hypothetical protein